MLLHYGLLCRCQARHWRIGGFCKARCSSIAGWGFVLSVDVLPDEGLISCPSCLRRTDVQNPVYFLWPAIERLFDEKIAAGVLCSLQLLLQVEAGSPMLPTHTSGFFALPYLDMSISKNPNEDQPVVRLLQKLESNVPFEWWRQAWLFAVLKTAEVQLCLVTVSE